MRSLLQRTQPRPAALILALVIAAACGGGGSIAGVTDSNQIKPDPLAIGSWDLDRPRADPATSLPFACETAQDKASWPCIPGAAVDTVVSGLVLLDGLGAYAVAISHRVILQGTTQVISRVNDEANLENSAASRGGTWGRSALRIVLYPFSIASPTRNADLSDTSFVHGLTTMSITGARFRLR